MPVPVMALRVSINISLRNVMMDLLAEMRRIQAAMAMSRPAYDRVDAGHDMMAHLMRNAAPTGPMHDSYSAFGIPVHKSSAFPHQFTCSTCAGTGDGGEESTYCEKCHGETRIEGTMSGGSWDKPQIALLTAKLPVKFPVSARFSATRRPSAGIQSVPWPS